MSDPALVLQGAVFAALSNSAAIKALLGAQARVYDAVPLAPVFPYITIGDDQIIDDSTTCGEAFEAFVTIHVWTRPVGKPVAKRIAAAVRDALDAALELTAFVVVTHEHRDTRYFRESDGVTEHAVATFRYLIDPA